MFTRHDWISRSAPNRSSQLRAERHRRRHVGTRDQLGQMDGVVVVLLRIARRGGVVGADLDAGVEPGPRPAPAVAQRQTVKPEAQDLVAHHLAVVVHPRQAPGAVLGPEQQEAQIAVPELQIGAHLIVPVRQHGARIDRLGQEGEGAVARRRRHRRVAPAHLEAVDCGRPRT